MTEAVTEMTEFIYLQLMLNSKLDIENKIVKQQHKYNKYFSEHAAGVAKLRTENRSDEKGRFANKNKMNECLSSLLIPLKNLFAHTVVPKKKLEEGTNLY